MGSISFFLNTMSFSVQNFQIANERVGKQSHYSISVVIIGILILGQKGKIGSIWVNVRNEILQKFLSSSTFSVTVFQEVLCSKTCNSFDNHPRQILHSQTHHQRWLGSMVSRFSRLRFIGKRR